MRSQAQLCLLNDPSQTSLLGETRIFAGTLRCRYVSPLGKSKLLVPG